MSASWVLVRDAVAASTLRAGDRGVTEMVSRFDALLRYSGLRLGTDVTPALSRKEAGDPALRTSALVQQLTMAGVLTGAIKIPSTVGQLEDGPEHSPPQRWQWPTENDLTPSQG